MSIGSPLDARTQPLNRKRSWRDWSGYLAASQYDYLHIHEYVGIRHAAVLIDVSPLYKYAAARPGRGAPDRPRHHPRRDQDQARPGRSTRRGATSTARSSTTAPSRASTTTRSAGRAPSRTCAGSARTRAASTSRSRTSANARAPSPSRDRWPATCCQRGDGHRLDGPALLPPPRPRRMGSVAVDVSRTGLHRRSRLRDLVRRGAGDARCGIA